MIRAETALTGAVSRFFNPPTRSGRTPSHPKTWRKLSSACPALPVGLGAGRPEPAGLRKVLTPESRPFGNDPSREREECDAYSATHIAGLHPKSSFRTVWKKTTLQDKYLRPSPQHR